MEAKDFIVLSEKVTDRENLEKVYQKIIVPKLRKIAELKGREFQIMDNDHDSKVEPFLKGLGFKGDLQYLCRQEMLPLLEEKGFSVSWSCYFTNIRW